MPVSTMPCRFASSTGPSFEPIRSHGGLRSFAGTPRWFMSRSSVAAQPLIGGLLHTCDARLAIRRSPRHMCRSNRLQTNSPQLIAWYVRGNDVANHASKTHASVKPLCVGRGGQQNRAKESWFAARSASWCGFTTSNQQTNSHVQPLSIHPPGP